MKEIKESSVKRFPLGTIIVNFDKEVTPNEEFQKARSYNLEAR